MKQVCHSFFYIHDIVNLLMFGDCNTPLQSLQDIAPEAAWPCIEDLEGLPTPSCTILVFTLQ